MVLHSTKAKTEAHSSVSQALSGLNGELFLTGGRLDPDPGDQVVWSLWERHRATRVAASFISLSASIYKVDEEARPDGICHKMLLQH